ncbi:MAG: hypothetical protein K2M49_08790 [Muribaculaceae bacterium]|nr:hypothetical protein [Muribaculaceae bacterium]
MKPQNKRVLDGDEITSLDMFQSIEPKLIDIIAATAIWVSPDKISMNPVYPDTKRGRAKDKGNVIDGIRIDDNTYANVAIKKAISGSIDFKNYMVCHIWPGTTNNERYHTLLANLVLIPRILANLSDYFNAVIDVLKYRSYELYGWHPDGTEVPQRPSYYPKVWREFLDDECSVADSIANPLKQYLEEEGYEQEKETLEIEKVKRKIPQWIKKPSQINSRILNLYMSLSKNNTYPVSHADLKAKFEQLYADPFESNFIQMKNVGTKNHAKVFSESKAGMVSLWAPIAVFVKDQFENTKIDINVRYC